MSTFSNSISRYSNSVFGHSLPRVAYPNRRFSVEYAICVIYPSCDQHTPKGNSQSRESSYVLILHT